MDTRLTHPTDSPRTTLADLSAVEIACLVRSRAVSAVEVLQSTLDRVGKLNPTLNAIVAARAVEALADAQSIDDRLRRGDPVGKLAGVPFTVKDVISTAGLPTTCGSRVVDGRLNDVDATAVSRMRKADAVLLGKTNCSEFAFSIDVTNARYGRTLNPRGYFTAGGSSGGEAAAVSAGFSALGLGTDFGGSVRWPAQCTRLVALRPTVGRIPGSGQKPAVDPDGPAPPNPLTLQGQLQVIGPLARTVDDAEVALRVLAGPDGLDPAAVPVDLGDSRTVCLQQVVARWGTVLGDIVTSAAVAERVSHAAYALERAGVEVREGLPTALDTAHDVYSQLRSLDPLDEIRSLAVGKEHELTHGIRQLVSASPVDRSAAPRLWAERNRLRQSLLNWLSGTRVLVLPVAVIPPFTPGDPLPAMNGRRLTEQDVVAPSRAVSLFGLPAVSVPFGCTPDGLPVSVQVVGPPFREDLVFAVARVLGHVS